MKNSAERQRSEWDNGELFHLIVKSVADYSIFAIDLEGRIRNWNKGAEHLFDYREEEIVGRSFAIIFTTEDRRQRVPERELETARIKGRSGDDRWHLRKDGSRFWASGLVVPLKDEAGNLIGYVKVARDATDRKRAEEALKVSEAEFRAIFEMAGTGKAEADLSTGRLLRVNQKLCEITGYSAEELLAMTIQELTHPEDREKDLAAFRHLARHQTEYAFEKRYRRKSGREVWAHVNVIALRNEEGNPSRMIVSVEEITRRKRAEAAAQEALARERLSRSEAEDAARSKDEFIALVSHELRSPLNAILGWTRILRQGRPDDELYERATEIIERSARMQSQLIEDLMDTARIVRGKLKLEVRPVNLVTVIEKAMDVVRPAAAAKGITLDARLAHNVGQITGDPDRLQQVVWNLLANAVKFTNEGGRVEVTLRRVDPYIQIIVSDTGRGISPEFMPHLFERYHQADASGGRGKGGLGLGLTLVRQLVEMHGGDVTAHSAGEGNGATFTVKLPVRAIYTAEPERAPLTSSQTKSLAGVWAIVVDDEANARELITSVLESYGARVTAFSSAVEALDLLRDGSSPGPDVLVCDLAMPGADGFSLIHKLREWEKAHDGVLPAIALTAFGRAEDRTRALYAGFQMHITKPVEPIELVVVVKSLIERGWRSKVSTGRQ
ncbi:MAG: PAS domain S-box protein [Blastocatellia bacterium]